MCAYSTSQSRGFFCLFFPVDPLWPPVRHKKPTKKFLSPDIQIKRGFLLQTDHTKESKATGNCWLTQNASIQTHFLPTKNEKKSRKTTIMTSFLSRVRNDKTPISPPKKKATGAHFEDDHSAYYGALKFLWLFFFSEKEEGNWKRRAASGLLLFPEKKAIWWRRRFNLWLSRPFPSLLLPNTQLNGHPPPYAQYLLPLKRKRK